MIIPIAWKKSAGACHLCDEYKYLDTIYALPVSASSGTIKELNPSPITAMTPEQEQALNAHIEVIAEILYDESDPAAMTTLEGIELTVREKIQAHVSPELGVFLSAKLAARNQANPAGSKAR